MEKSVCTNIIYHIYEKLNEWDLNAGMNIIYLIYIK